MDAHVSTFYSFKGGVGRTLLMANVGRALADQGAKVLLWDLDVEAPGLHHVVPLGPEQPRAQGFFEWILELQDAGFQPLSSERLDEFRALAYPVRSGGKLFVLPAYGGEANFARLYGEIRWGYFIEEDPVVGLTMFRQMLAALSADGYDHVLIDSRTGVTDLGGLLTAYLPDLTVFVGNYSEQNTAGLSRIYRSLDGAAEGKLEGRAKDRLRRLLVASPVPRGLEERALEARRKVWEDAFQVRFEESRIEIPFLARLLFREELVVRSDPDDLTAAAYRQVARKVAALRDEMLLKSQTQKDLGQLYPGPEGTAAQPEGARRSFADEVRHLLSLLGHTVTDAGVQGADMLARRTSGLDHTELLVACKAGDQPMTVQGVEACFESFARAAPGKPWIPTVVAERLEAAAAERFSTYATGIATTARGLEDSLFDRKAYLATLRQEYEESPLSRRFIEPRLTSPARLPEQAGDLDAIESGLDWAQGHGPTLRVIAGEPGAGKTVFARALAYRLALKAAKDDDAPSPVLISLRGYAAPSRLESIFLEHLSRISIPFVDPRGMMHLLGRGRIVLILDEVEEMASVGGSASLFEEQLRHLARPTLTREPSEGNRILITTRPRLGDADAIQIAARLGAQVDSLAPWSEQQVRHALSQGTGIGGHASQVLLRLVSEWGQNPQMVDVLKRLGTLMGTRSGGASRAEVYEQLVSVLLGAVPRADGAEKEQEIRALEQLAVELRGRPGFQVHDRELPTLLDESRAMERYPIHGGERETGSRHNEQLLANLATTQLINRSDEGYVRFTSTQVMEYLLARRLARSIGTASFRTVLGTVPLAPDTAELVAQLVVREQRWTSLAAELRAVLKEPYQPGLSETVVRLAHDIGRAVAGEVGPGLTKVMSELVPSGARLENADLRQASLQHGWLEGAFLTEARLDGANLSRANLAGVRAGGLSARGAILDGVDLTGAFLQEADLSASRATGTAPRLQRGHLSGANVTGSVWRAPELAGAEGHLRGGALARWSVPPTAGDAEPVVAVPSLAGTAGAIATSRDGTVVVTASHHSLRVWSGTGLSPVMELESQERVTSVSCAADGTVVAIGSRGGRVGLWAPRSGSTFQSLRPHGGYSLGVAVSARGDLVATASDDGTGCVIEVESERIRSCVSAPAGVVFTCVSISPDGRLVARGLDSGAVLISSLEGEEVSRWQAHPGSVVSVAFDPASPECLATSGPEGARLWTVAGDLLERFAFPKVGEVSFSGTHLALTHRRGVVVWALGAGKVHREVPFHGWSGAATLLPGTDKVVATGTSGLNFEHVPGGVRPHSAQALSLAVLSKEVVAVGYADGTLRRWNVSTGKLVGVVSTPYGAVECLGRSPDGKQLVIGSVSGTADLWDAAANRKVRTLSWTGVVRAAFSPDGQQIALTGRGAFILDLQSGKAMALGAPRTWTFGLAYSPDGALLATSCDDSAVRVCDAKTGKAIHVLRHRGEILSVCFGRDGRLIYAGGSRGVLHVWDAATGLVVRELVIGEADLFTLAVSPRGDRMVIGDGEGALIRFDTATGKHERRAGAHWDAICAVEMLPDERRFLTASLDGTVGLWDLDSSALVARFVALPSGGAAIAGPWVSASSPEALELLSVQVGPRMAPMSLAADLCLQPDHVRDAIAGKQHPPPRISLDAASWLRAQGGSVGSS
ncbi:MAG TPA: pentapeptide repeat-containing protein [Myxococcaceae bacterium]|jgi:WD40 repeat protein